MASGDLSIGRPAQRRVVAVLVIIAGLVLVAVTLATNLFKVGPAFENLITDFRPALSQQSIDVAGKDIAGLQAVSEEFQTTLAPRLAQQLGQTPEQFAGFMRQQFPDVATGMAALPEVVPTFTGLIGTLDQQRPLFASADAIPTKDLPATTVPWALLGVGILTIAVGALIWFTSRAGAVIGVLLGLAIVIASLVMSLPGKAADADQLNANLKPVYTQQMVDQAKGALATVSAMGAQMTGQMMPALATQLKMQPEQLQAFLGENFPATAAALTSMPASLGRFQTLVNTFEANLGNYDTLKPADFTLIIWIMFGSGVAVLLFSAWGLFTARPREAARHSLHPEVPTGISPVA